MDGARSYPPRAVDVLAVLVRWLEAEGRGVFEVERQPDGEERNARTCDYICAESRTGERIAVEVTSMWRSEQAGAEDAAWAKWQAEVARLLSGRVAGEYHVATPLAVSKASPPQQVADDLLQLIQEADWDSAGERYVPGTLGGLDCRVWRWDEAGSAVEFQRFAPGDGFELAAGEFLAAVAQYKREQLASWKQSGLPTYLLVYNTYWPLQSPSDVQRMVDTLSTEISRTVDQLVVVSGNAPDDAWCRSYRLPR